MSRAVLQHYKIKNVVHGIAHITGGGLQENLQRILPPHVEAQVAKSAWEIPPVFRWLQQLGDVDDEEMFRVFNMGIGFCAVVPAREADRAAAVLKGAGSDVHVLGHAI